MRNPAHKLMSCPINPIMTDEACFERHKQAVEYLEQGISRYRECLECELTGGIETMKYGYGECRICGRTVHLQSGGRCHFCEEQRKLAKSVGITDEELITETIQNWTSTHQIYRGMRASKLIDWAAIASEKLKITHVEPPTDIKLTEPASVSEEKYQDNGAEEKAKAERLIEDLKQKYPTTSRQMDIVSDAGYSLLIPLTDRETDLMKWIDTLAVEQRRTREQQILWMLEVAMSQEAA